MVFSSTSGGSAWVPSPFSGISYSFLKLGGSDPAVVTLRKIAAGSTMPPHRHPNIERNYLISGRAQLLDGSIIEAGAYMEIPAGVRHGATALEECVFHDSYDGSLVWVEDSGTMTAVNSNGDFVPFGSMPPLSSANLPI
jgi:quercetin dioxygenase-like cupin family protein